MSDLLDAVDTLTKPIIEHIAQRADSGKWIRTHTVERAPLLQQMHDAVTPSGGNDGASKSSAAAERSPADLDALFEYAKITSQIRSWLVIAKLVPTHEPIDNLRRWYVAHTAERDHVDDWYLRMLRGWAAHIKRMLDKPCSFVPEAACPVCGATEWGNMIEGGGRWPIKIEYRLAEDGVTPKDHSALCQLCRTVWEGHDAVVELADELNGRQEA
jgi:hypothetical protein